ncbi:uncharacterized protein BDZ99DRAFT_480942 [Mytilinidion resinicola]|uniref:Uncharacterized protein n=1 Tax=Mytilinidion resinicola TaxID=574789 RepID=A0A6A6Y7Y8_9PEZI|nr:uncharacterized protein BDZ99DRAFT_480942 [Mytilinidion resinicola]KAF2804946.1 hypothetical protein BDZ99DRAFT_480942 [Mytilinidion resinicola]
MPIVESTRTVTLKAHGTSYQLLAANIADITTVFTPPASCATPCYFPNDYSRSDVALIGTACSYSGNDHKECEPGSYNSSATVFPYYSPGLCPHDTMACSPISEIAFAPNVTTQLRARVLLDNPNLLGPERLRHWTLLASSSSAPSASLAAANSSTSASSSSLTSTQQPIFSQSPTTSQPPKGGLSAGAKGGIGIGVVIVVSLIAGGVYLYIRHLKKALKAARDEPEQAKSELPATGKKRVEPVEMGVPSHAAHELAVNEIPVELDGQVVEEARRL